MAFDPDEYLAQSNAPQSSGQSFDPDKYLETTREVSGLESGLRGGFRGASLGFVDELAGGLEAAGRTVGLKGAGGSFSDWELDSPNIDWVKNYREGRDKRRGLDKKAKEANPFAFGAGEVGGGIATALVPGLGAAKSIKGLAGVGAGLGATASLGSSEADLTEPGNELEALKDIGLGAAIGGVGGAAFGVAGKGLKKAADYGDDKLKALAELINFKKKTNAPTIQEAAKRMGFKPTPGMLNDSKALNLMEDSLAQSPTIGGALMRREQRPVFEAMQRSADDLISEASPLSNYEAGELAKSAMKSKVTDRFKPSIDAFNDLAKYTKDIPSTEKSVNTVSRNLLKIPEVDLLEGSKGASLARSIGKALEKRPDANQIKSLRTIVGRELENAEGADRAAIGAIYDKLGRLEENTIKRGVLSSARTKGEGNKIAADMLTQLRGAKQGYREGMGELSDFALGSGLRTPKSPAQFSSQIDKLPSDKMADKFLNLGDARKMESMKKLFPKAYDELRKRKLGQIAQKASDSNDVLPNRLVTRTKDLSKEAKQNLFGDKAPMLEDLRLIKDNLPPNIGPSGTPQGMSYLDINVLNQMKDIGRYSGYKALSSNRAQKIAESLRKMKGFGELAEKSPEKFNVIVANFARKMAEKEPGLKVGGEQEFENISSNESTDFLSQPVSDDEARMKFLEGN